MHQHRLVTDNLGTFLVMSDDVNYLDIEFIFSENSTRTIKLRMYFCSPSIDPVATETMNRILGVDLKTMHVQVVSFLNTEQLDSDTNDYFSKPEGSINLNFSELNYLYGTLVDLMLKVAENENIDVLYFSAYEEKLNKIYSRYVKFFAKMHNLEYEHDGGSYAIRMQRHS